MAFKVGGYVDALQQVRGVDGKMRDMQEGDRITAGAVLARVRQSDYQVKFKRSRIAGQRGATQVLTSSKAQYQEALSGIASSKAQLAEAEAAYVKAKLDYDRAQNLFASQSMTKANYDAAKAQYDMATAKVAAARSQVRMIEAKADSAKANIEVIQAKSRGAQAVVQETKIPLQDTALRSPLNGVVLEKSIEKGTLVSSGDNRIHRCRHVVGQSGLRRGGHRRGGNETGKDLERRERNDAWQGISGTDHIRVSGCRFQEPSHSMSR